MRKKALRIGEKSLLYAKKGFTNRRKKPFGCEKRLYQYEKKAFWMRKKALPIRQKSFLDAKKGFTNRRKKFFWMRKKALPIRKKRNFTKQKKGFSTRKNCYYDAKKGVGGSIFVSSNASAVNHSTFHRLRLEAHHGAKVRV